MCHCLPSLLLFSSCSPTCPTQVLARRLSPDSWDGESSVSVIPGADLRAVPGQVCGVRQDERRRGGSPALLLHDRRQGGQDPGAAGELWGGGAEQRHRGAARRRNRSGRRASDNPSTSVILSSVFFFLSSADRFSRANLSMWTATAICPLSPKVGSSWSLTSTLSRRTGSLSTWRYQMCFRHTGAASLPRLPLLSYVRDC